MRRKKKKKKGKERQRTLFTSRYKGKRRTGEGRERKGRKRNGGRKHRTGEGWREDGQEGMEFGYWEVREEELAGVFHSTRSDYCLQRFVTHAQREELKGFQHKE